VDSNKVDFRWNTPVKELLDRYGGPKVRKFAAVRARAYMSTYCPFRTGALSLAQAEATENGVVYNVPYARRFYYGDLKPKRIFHPLATDHWDEAFVRNEIMKLVTDISKYITQKGGGT